LGAVIPLAHPDLPLLEIVDFPLLAIEELLRQLAAAVGPEVEAEHAVYRHAETNVVVANVFDDDCVVEVIEFIDGRRFDHDRRS